MKQMILDALQALHIETWEMTEQRRASAELFFVKKQLDMRRMKDVTEYEVTVYRDVREGENLYRGSSKVLLFPGMQATAAEQTLRDAYAAAAYVKNRHYELYRGAKASHVCMPSQLAQLSLQEGAARMAEALFAEDTRSDAWINSAEIFIRRNDVALCSSEGVEASYVKYDCTGEFVAQAVEPQDVEQYFEFRYEDLETAALAQKVKDALATVRDRALAKDAPAAGNYDIVLSGEHVATLLELYATRAHVSMIYPHYSDWTVGSAAQGAEICGEKLNLILVPSTPYSQEGIPMVERTLLKEGQVQCIYGGNRFCRYLGVEPTGDYERLRLENGTVAFEQMKQGCLYPVSFSDFQMDPFTGHFGGEIRLAYLYDGGKVKLLTGGSINGSLLEKQGQLRFSLEKYRDAAYEGPLAVRIPGVNVNGK